MSQCAHDDLLSATNWASSVFDVNARAFPFSFAYGGVSVDSGDARWKCTETGFADGEDAARTTITLRDQKTGLACICEIVRFKCFPVVEWLLRFSNEGDDKTPIISDITPLDTVFATAGRTVLHHANGSLCQIDDFAPHATVLEAGSTHRLATTGGRSSNGALPFFNLETGDGGVIGAIGWTGNWACSFDRNPAETVCIRAGMQRTHLYLNPGETIRSPRIMVLFWSGDRIDSQNQLRSFLLAHHTPEAARKPATVPLSYVAWGENRAERQIAKARWFALHEVRLDNFWIDAGWHGDAEFCEKATVFNTNWGAHVGNWWPNKDNYPGGLKPIGDAVRSIGMAFTLWFEPERVFKGTYFATEHPEWLLGPIGDNSLYHLGDPDARTALTDALSSIISEGGVTVYRQDFNMDPEPFWAAADTPDRVGMSEIRHIEGLYALWDELIARHPGLLIDNCSSGGRRIDIETTSRSIPLWRSDFQCYPNFDPIGIQGQTHGLSLWVPLSAGCCDRPDTYAFRSTVMPGAVLTTAVADEGEPEGYRTPWDAFPLDWLQRMASEYQELKPFAAGDFYPLVTFSLADDVWALWQFHRPDLDSGVVIALRRQNSPYPQVEAKLKALVPGAVYQIRSFDGEGTQVHKSDDLLELGFAIEIREKPSSRLFRYNLLK